LPMPCWPVCCAGDMSLRQPRASCVRIQPRLIG
jgi:hypothetical protein